jgi:hypothetical protein
MKLLNFDNPTGIRTESTQENGYEYETNNPEDVVTGNNLNILPSALSIKEDSVIDRALPWAQTPYNLEPGHGLSVVDMLRRVAESIKLRVAASNEDNLNWKQALTIIKNTFKENKLKLVEFKDRNKPEAIPYYTQKTAEGIFFWIHHREQAEASLNEAVKRLQANGMTATRKESGILLQPSAPLTEVFTTDAVATYTKGTIVQSDPNDEWSKLDVKGTIVSYSYDPICKKLSIYCSKGPIEVGTSFQVTNANSKQIAKIIKYQVEIYKKLFNPETYGLVSTTKPLKLKKHIITYCDNGISFIVTPEGHVFAMTEKGESRLCKEEGKISLNPELSFRRVTPSTKYVYGEMWNKFGHLLNKRGLLK